jgi:multidrug efflux pump subunit AcrA (membrane-fusion protein)
MKPGEFDAKANQTAIIKIIDYSSPEAMVVPVNIIQKSFNDKYIYIAKPENNKLVARKQTVSVGRIYNGRAEITKGLKPGDVIITAGYLDLNDGITIAISK